MHGSLNVRTPDRKKRPNLNKSFLALALSFGVYLFPLIGPHTVSLLGQVLWIELTRGERAPFWIATDIGFALMLQSIAFAALCWFFMRPAVLRVLVLAAAVPFAWIAVEYAYLVFIPSRFLIEEDTATERGDWAIECSARDVGLVEVSRPSSLLVWSELLVQAIDGSYKLMRIPGCELTPLAIPQAKIQPGGRADFITGVTYFVPDHGVIFSRQETATGAFTWNHLLRNRITPIPGLHAAASPILSVDGNWAAWLEKEAIAIESINVDEAPLQVIPDNFKGSSYTLRTVDMQRGEIELVSSDRRTVVGLDGSIKSSTTLPLFWDVYRDDGPPRVSWNTEGGSGTHNVLKGRLINSVAMSPSRDLIAVSVGTALNIGQIRDSIYILRVKDGVEIFRRYLPTYTRTPVYFPADDLLAYTADRQVVVLRVTR